MVNREVIVPLRSPLGLDATMLGFCYWAMAHVLACPFKLQLFCCSTLYRVLLWHRCVP